MMVIYYLFFSLQNAVCFIILTYLVPVLFTFYIQDVLKLKKNSGAKRLKYRRVTKFERSHLNVRRTSLEWHFFWNDVAWRVALPDHFFCLSLFVWTRQFPTNKMEMNHVALPCLSSTNKELVFRPNRSSWIKYHFVIEHPYCCSQHGGYESHTALTRCLTKTILYSSLRVYCLMVSNWNSSVQITISRKAGNTNLTWITTP